MPSRPGLLRGGTRRGAAVLVAMVSAAAMSGCTQRVGGAAGYVGGTGVVTVVEPAERKAAPDIAGESLDGEPLALADFAGSVVVLNVWGSWCAPCRSEAPALVAAAETLAPDDVQFLGINVREPGQQSNARAFVRSYEIPYPSIYDPDSSTLLGIEPRPAAIPSTIVIDRDGQVAALVLGEVDESTLVELVRDVDRDGVPAQTRANGVT